jgi:hypothetical protein
MSKMKTESQNPSAKIEPKKPLYALPEGYEEKTQSSDLVGFWDPERGPVHFVPQFAKAFDNHTENVKTSIVIVGQAIGKNPIIDGDGKPGDCEDGEMIGVWYKPGMSHIKNFADVAVYLYQSGELDTGKPKPMKTFSLNVKKGAKGNELRIQEDYRKKSAHTSLPFETKTRRRTPGPAEDADENFARQAQAQPMNGRPIEDDIPFG